MFDEDSRKGTKYLEKKNFVFKIIAFESGAASYHIPQQDTCHRQPMC